MGMALRRNAVFSVLVGNKKPAAGRRRFFE